MIPSCWFRFGCSKCSVGLVDFLDHPGKLRIGCRKAKGNCSGIAEPCCATVDGQIPALSASVVDMLSRIDVLGA